MLATFDSNLVALATFLTITLKLLLQKSAVSLVLLVSLRMFSFCSLFLKSKNNCHWPLQDPQKYHKISPIKLHGKCGLSTVSSMFGLVFSVSCCLCILNFIICGEYLRGRCYSVTKKSRIRLLLAWKFYRTGKRI